MEEIFTTQALQSNFNGNSDRLSPRKTTINFIKQFARVYTFTRTSNAELGNFIVN